MKGVVGALLFASWQEYVSRHYALDAIRRVTDYYSSRWNVSTLAGPLVGAIVFLVLEETLPFSRRNSANLRRKLMILFGSLMLSFI